MIDNAIGDHADSMAQQLKDIQNGLGDVTSLDFTNVNTIQKPWFFMRHIRFRALTPAQIVANKNDYQLADFPVLRLSTDASRNITGFQNGTDGRVLTIMNVGSFDVVITHQDTNSAAVNRIITHTAGSLTIGANQELTLWYDIKTLRWRVLSAAQGNIVASGVYTPTLTEVANLDSSSNAECQWMRVGNTVTVSGKFTIDPTTTLTNTQLGISLPVASDFGAVEDCGGVAYASAIATQGFAIRADATNNRAEVVGKCVDTTSQIHYFIFTYQVL